MESQIFNSGIDKANAAVKAPLFPSLGTKWKLKLRPRQLALVLSKHTLKWTKDFEKKNLNITNIVKKKVLNLFQCHLS